MTDRRTVLEAALIGFREQQARIAASIEEIQEELSGPIDLSPHSRLNSGKLTITEKRKRKRKLSEQGLANIRAGLRKRWNKYYKAQAQKAS